MDIYGYCLIAERSNGDASFETPDANCVKRFMKHTCGNTKTSQTLFGHYMMCFAAELVCWQMFAVDQRSADGSISARQQLGRSGNPTANHDRTDQKYRCPVTTRNELRFAARTIDKLYGEATDL